MKKQHYRPTDKKLKQFIHIAKGKLGLDDDLYRSILTDLTGKRSCSDMGYLELTKVLDHFKSLGFKVTRSKKGNSPVAKGKTIDVMRALWIQMNKAGHVRNGSELALCLWASTQTERIAGLPCDRLEWLATQPALCSKVLESLKLWHRRVMK